MPWTQILRALRHLKVYFPDGTMTELNGGLSKFQDLVVQSLKNGFDPAFQCNLEKSACYNHKDNNFVNLCLLQFLFGIGGPDELQKKLTEKYP